MLRYIKPSISEQIGSFGKSIMVTIPETDCFKYNEERIATYNLLMTMVHKNLYHLVKAEMTDKNPAKIYTIIFNHFNGHKHRHIQNAENMESKRNFSKFCLAFCICLCL